MRFYLYFRGPDVQKAGEISTAVLAIAIEPPLPAAKSLF